MDTNQFIDQCNRKSLQDLEPYAGKWVAWSDDGKNILAHAADQDELYRQIDRMGLAGYVIDFIPHPDEDFMGGGLA